MARILDGVAIAAQIKQEVAEEVRALAAQGIRPGLAAVLVGNVAASEIYVRNKVRICGEVGIFSDLIKLPESVTTAELLALVAQLNARDEIDGILVQLPLPAQVDVKTVLDAILPAKDVDGLHPLNAGLLQAGRTGARSLHARGSHRNSQAQRIRHQRPARGGCRPQRLGRQAGGHAAAAPERHGYHLPLQDPRPGRRSPAKPIFWSPLLAAPASSRRRWSNPAQR